MGHSNSKRKYNYINNIKEETPEEVIMEPKIEEEVIIEQEVGLEEKEQPVILYSVKVTHPCLRRRSAPEVKNNIVGLISDQGIYDIYAEVGGWGKLEDGTWIMLQYTEKISE